MSQQIMLTPHINLLLSNSTHAERSVDLHIHTTASDGLCSPLKLVQKAAVSGLSAIAITDHDTVSGVISCQAEANRLGIEIVPGVEMSVKHHLKMHIIGLYIDINDNCLQHTLNKLQRIRMRLITKAFSVANSQGIHITPSQLIDANKDLSLRSFLDYIMENKLFQSEIDLLFKPILDEWHNNLPNPAECISLIHEYKGLAFLAHPRQLSADDEQVLETIIQLEKIGLDGIECIHPKHTIEDCYKYLYMAQQLGLLYSGGSDYHGNFKSHHDVNFGLGNITVPYSCLEAIKYGRKVIKC